MSSVLRCAGRRRDGRRCQAAPLRGDVWCAWHVPERAQRPQAVRFWGGPCDGLELGSQVLPPVLRVSATPQEGISAPVIRSYDTVRPEELVPGTYVLERHGGRSHRSLRYRWYDPTAALPW